MFIAFEISSAQFFAAGFITLMVGPVWGLLYISVIFIIRALIAQKMVIGIENVLQTLKHHIWKTVSEIEAERPNSADGDPQSAELIQEYLGIALRNELVTERLRESAPDGEVIPEEQREKEYKLTYKGIEWRDQRRRTSFDDYSRQDPSV